MPWKPKPAVQRPRPRDYRKHAAARGYDYQWQQFRKRYLAQHPLCVDCLEPDPLETENAFETPQPIVAAAVHIHHKAKLSEQPELKYEEGNLMPLCERHHNVRTARGE